jgi:tryptophan-rich sensory protein
MNFLDSEPDPKQFRALKLFLIAALAVGAVAQVAATPAPVPVPPWAIAPLWTLSYGLMAVAGWLAFKRAGLKSFELALFAAQLALNLIWRLAPLPVLGLAMNLCALATLILFARRNFVAAVTFLPSVIWCLFVSLPMNGFWRLY